MRLNWKVTLFSVFFLCVFVRLGFWQLEREAEKVELLQQQAVRINQAPTVLEEAAKRDSDDIHLAPLRTRGEYDSSRVFLLDNRVLEGVVGYEVLVPFRETASGLWMLVNRGFVPMGRTRDTVPDIPVLVPGEVNLLGEVYVADYPSLPGANVAATLDDLTVVQVADPTVISGIAGETFFVHLVRLSIEDAHALPRHWPVTVMQPETHRGYAVQWFLMALAVTVAWLAFTVSDSRSRSRTESKEEALS